MSRKWVTICARSRAHALATDIADPKGICPTPMTRLGGFPQRGRDVPGVARLEYMALEIERICSSR